MKIIYLDTQGSPPIDLTSSLDVKRILPHRGPWRGPLRTLASENEQGI